jgi:hypothetical protein
MMDLAQTEDGQTMILATVLLVQMVRPRCQRLHRKVYEGLVHSRVLFKVCCRKKGKVR